MTSKQPTPPPKFNIQDRVIYNFSRWKITKREYKSRGWWYKLESFEENRQGVHNTEAFEEFITLSSPATPQETKPMPDPKPGYRLLSKDPPEDLQPGDDWWDHDEQRWRGVSNPYNINQHKTTYYRRKITPPPPKFIAGDLVRYCNEAAKIISAAFNATENRYEYKIRIRTGTHLFHIPEDALQIEKLEGHFDEVDSKWLDEPSPFKDRKTKTVVNEQGGKQSHLDARFDCIPPVVLRLLAQCLGFGARKYGDENWKNIPQRDNLNHTMNHINEWNRGNRDEPHLVNAMARLTFALWQAVDSKDQPDTYTNNSSE